MTTREAAIEQLKALKGQPLKVKLKHICTYYWLPIVAVIAIVAIAASCLLYLTTEKKPVLNVSVQNLTMADGNVDRFMASFAQRAGIDLEKEQIVISADRTFMGNELGAYDGEVLAAQIVGGMIDVLISDVETISQWLYQDLFADLSELLTQEQLDAYKGSVLYLDAAVLRKTDELNDTEGTISFPDPRKPEEMEEPVPVAVVLSANSEFSRQLFPGADTLAMGIVGNASNIENAQAFLNYIME